VGSAALIWVKDWRTKSTLSKEVPTPTRTLKSADVKRPQSTVAHPPHLSKPSTSTAARTTQSVQTRTTKCLGVPRRHALASIIRRVADSRRKVKICNRGPQRKRRSASSGTITSSRTSNTSSKMTSPQRLASQSTKSLKSRRDSRMCPHI
jgi:hypothetical protein